MKRSILRAVDAGRRPMVGQEPGLRDLQDYLLAAPTLQGPLLAWLEGLEPVVYDERDDATEDTEAP